MTSLRLASLGHLGGATSLTLASLGHLGAELVVVGQPTPDRKKAVFFNRQWVFGGFRTDYPR